MHQCFLLSFSFLQVKFSTVCLLEAWNLFSTSNSSVGERERNSQISFLIACKPLNLICLLRRQRPVGGLRLWAAVTRTVQQEILTTKQFSGSTLIIFICQCTLLVLCMAIREKDESHYSEWWVCVRLVYTGGVQLQRIELLSANVFWRQTNLQLNEQLARTNLN